PLSTTGLTAIGALNVYSGRADGFSDTDIGRAAGFGDHASSLIAQAASVATTANQNAHLHLALETRERVGEAKGILMERHGLTSDEAFDQLRRASQHANRKLRDIAEELIDSTRSEARHDG